MKSRLNWTRIRDEYVIGDESFVQIALRYGTQPKLVENHALNRRQNDGRTWGELRKEFNAQISRVLSRDAAKLLSEVAQQRLALTNEALRKLIVHIDRGTLDTPDLIAAAKLGIDPRLEISGVRAEPIKYHIDLGLDPETRAELDQQIADAIAMLNREPAKRQPSKNGKSSPASRQGVV